MQSPPCLCILGFHCILWQLVLNIIRHISVPRKIIIGFGLFSLDSFTSENLQISVYTVGKSFGIVDIFDRIYFIWPKLMIYANFWNGDGLLFILTIYCFSLGIRRFLSYFLINGYEPIVFCWSSNVFRHFTSGLNLCCQNGFEMYIRVVFLYALSGFQIFDRIFVTVQI